MDKIYARRIALEDIPAYHKVLTEVINEKHLLTRTKPPVYVGVENFIKDSIKNDAAHFVAVKGTEVIGWCSVLPSLSPNQEHIGNLEMGVHKSYRGQGIGKLLLDETMEYLIPKTIEIIHVETYENNLAAIRLFEMHGFSQIGLKENFAKSDDGYLNVVMLSRRL